MKKFMMQLVFAIMIGGTLLSCGRDDDYPRVIEPKKEEIVPLKDFTLEKTEITVKRGISERIIITSGNGEYDYTQNLGVALLNLSRDKGYFEITALQDGGMATTHITDIKSGKRIKITIHTTK